MSGIIVSSNAAAKQIIDEQDMLSAERDDSDESGDPPDIHTDRTDGEGHIAVLFTWRDQQYDAEAVLELAQKFTTPTPVSEESDDGRTFPHPMASAVCAWFREWTRPTDAGRKAYRRWVIGLPMAMGAPNDRGFPEVEVPGAVHLVWMRVPKDSAAYEAGAQAVKVVFGTGQYRDTRSDRWRMGSNGYNVLGVTWYHEVDQAKDERSLVLTAVQQIARTRYGVGDSDEAEYTVQPSWADDIVLQ